MNSLPKTVTQQLRDYDLNPGPSAPESGTLTTRLRSFVHGLARTNAVHIARWMRVLCARYFFPQGTSVSSPGRINSGVRIVHAPFTQSATDGFCALSDSLQI